MLRFLTALLLLFPIAARAEVSKIRIARQPSILYFGSIIMERPTLVEAPGASLGMPKVAAKYLALNSRGSAIDSLLACDLQIVTGGISNMLLLWDRTKGPVGIKGFAGHVADTKVLRTHPAGWRDVIFLEAHDMNGNRSS